MSIFSTPVRRNSAQSRSAEAKIRSWIRSATLLSVALSGFVALSSARAEMSQQWLFDLDAESKRVETPEERRARLFETMMTQTKNPDLLKRLDELIKRVSLPESFGTDTKDLTPEDSIHRQLISASFPASGIKALHVEKHFDDVELLESGTDEIHVVAEVLADPENEARLPLLAKSVTFSNDKGRLVVSEQLMGNTCVQYKTKGMFLPDLMKENTDPNKSHLSMRGSCFGRVFVYLPENADVRVTFDTKVVRDSSEPIGTGELISNLKQTTFSSEQLKLIDSFIKAQKPGYTIKGGEMASILQSFAFSGDRLKALVLLAPFLPRTEAKHLKPAFSGFIGSDRQEAYEILINLPETPSCKGPETGTDPLKK